MCAITAHMNMLNQHTKRVRTYFNGLRIKYAAWLKT